MATERPDLGTFTCDNCGGTFKKHWTDEEAEAEHDRNFPGETPAAEMKAEDKARVCDDCYIEILAWAKMMGLGQ